MERATRDVDGDESVRAPRRIDGTRAQAQSRGRSASDRRSLQAQVGNQGIQRLSDAGQLQTKLVVGAPDDEYEREAERVADAVVGNRARPTSIATDLRPESNRDRESRDDTGNASAGGSPPREAGSRPSISSTRPTASSLNDRLQRLCPRCRDRYRAGKPLHCRECERELGDDDLVRRKPAPTAERSGDPGVEGAVTSALSGGRPLPTETRSFFERRFGRDFGDVRIHTGSAADRAARAVDATAFTVGRDVAFRSGAYQPGTRPGKRLLAHELTHVVQQRGGGGGRLQRQYVGGSYPEGYGQHYVETAQEESSIDTGHTYCSDQQSNDLDTAHQRATTMLDTALRKLANYDGSDPTEVTQAMEDHFKTSGTAFAEWLEFNLRFLDTMAPMASYQCSSSGRCSGGTLAWAAWCVPLFDIRICDPAFFNDSPEDQAATLIHEWTHKYGCNFDFGYAHESDYSQQGTGAALLNADPWAEFVRDVS